MLLRYFSFTLLCMKPQSVAGEGQHGWFGKVVDAAAGEDEFDGGFQTYIVADRDVDGLDV